MTERRHRLARLTNRLPTDVASVAPLQGEVLEEHDAELVSGRVQVVGGDVRLHSEGVEPGFDGTFDIGADQFPTDVSQPGTGGNEVGALEEHPLAIDREHPVGERHFTQAGPARRPVADLAVDDDFDTDVGERLPAERMRPPQRRRGDVERPLDVVAAGGDGVFGLADDLTVGGSAHSHGVDRQRVQAGVQAKVGTGFVGVAAQHPQAVDANGAGLVDAHGAPQTARVPLAVDGLGVLQHPGDVASPRRAALGGAGDLDG